MKENEIVNNLRVVGVEMITNAKSGHPGVVLGASPIFYAIFKNLKVDKDNLKYFNRDFFVNSAGHSSALNYACMNLFDMNLKRSDLFSFRKLNSKTPGHPEISTCGIDCSTGPLGQGVANSVGIAISQKFFVEKFNKKDIKIFDGVTYCFFGDGCLMEGISSEAFSIASALKLNNLIFVYDKNNKTIEGSTDCVINEDIDAKFRSMNFNVFHVSDGNDIKSIENAIKQAKTSVDKPNVIIVDTLIGFGSHVEDSEISHGKPFSVEETQLLKNKLNVKSEFMSFKAENKKFVEKIIENKQKIIEKEKYKLEKYKKKYPKDYEKLEEFFNFSKNNEVLGEILKLNADTNLSSRENNQFVLNKICEKLENILGGSADVNTSTMAYIKNEGYFNENHKQRNIHFGVREHAMGAICNGITLFGGIFAFCSCYLSFSDYLKPALRMTAQMNLPVLYAFSHDNILIGEDGPTHQPIEQLVGLRAMDNLAVFRPYNLSEVIACYEYFVKQKKPTAIILSKEKVNAEKSSLSCARKGGYVVFKEIGELKAVILTSGMETQIAINVAKKLGNIRVVSMPCHSVFDHQSKKYREEILTNKPKIALEFSSCYSYHKYVAGGLYLTLDCFGKSGKGKEVQKYFGLDEETLILKIKKFLKNCE